MNALESNVAALAVKATVLLVLGLAVHASLRRASAATRHLALTLVVLGLGVLPLLSSSLPAWKLALLAPTPTAVPAPAPDGPATPDDGPSDGTLEAGTPRVASESGAPSGLTALPLPGPALGLLLAWALGAGLVLAKLAAGLLRMRWIVHRGERVAEPGVVRLLDDCVDRLALRVRPLLVTSDRVDVPLVWGWLRPVLVVPRSFPRWGAGCMRVVLLHELGHLRRNDWAVLVLGRLMTGLYWFHPLVWIVERCAKRECERACDDIVVTCGTKPSEYASHLLSIARGVAEAPANVQAALAVVRRSNLNHRLRSILSPIFRRNTPSRPAAAGLGTALLLVLAPLASLQLTERAQADEPRKRHAERSAESRAELQGTHADPETESEEAQRAYKSGYELHGKGHYAEAIESFKKALDLGFRPETQMYNIACCHALLRDVEQAMQWLDRAFEAGLDKPARLVEDRDFDPLQREDAFQTYIDRAFAAANLERRFPDHYPYRATLERLQELKASASTDGMQWHEVGFRLISLGEYEQAIVAFESAAPHMAEKKATALYNLGCANALAGNSREALRRLGEAVEAGFDQHEGFLHDADLNSLRSLPEFARLTQQSEFFSLGRFPRRSWEDSDYSVERWAPALREYQDYVAKSPSSGRAWFNLGYALHHSSRHDEAAAAFDKAAALEFRKATSTYNTACAHAMAGRKGAALDALEAAAKTGAMHHEQLQSDGDLDGLRDEPRFRELSAQLERQAEAYDAEKLKWKKEKEKEKVKEKTEQARTY